MQGRNHQRNDRQAGCTIYEARRRRTGPHTTTLVKLAFLQKRPLKRPHGRLRLLSRSVRATLRFVFRSSTESGDICCSMPLLRNNEAGRIPGYRPRPCAGTDPDASFSPPRLRFAQGIGSVGLLNRPKKDLSRWEPDVRFGSLADISQCNRHVRFTPNSRHKSGHRFVR